MGGVVGRAGPLFVSALMAITTVVTTASPVTAVAAPGNDAFASAVTISGLPYTDAAVNTALATKEQGEPDPSCYAPGSSGTSWGNSIWYTFVAAANTTVSASVLPANLVGNGILPIIAAYSGTSMGALTRIGCAYASSANAATHLAFTVAAGTTYLIQVASNKNASSGGIFDFTLKQQIPPNDFFAFAKEVTAIPYTDAGVNTTLATTETGEPGPRSSGPICWWVVGGGNTAWYKFVAPTTTTVSASVLPVGDVGNGITPVIAAYTGSSINALSELGCVDTNTNVAAHLAFPVAAGTTYYIQVGGGSWARGGVFDFTLKQQIPPNDFFAFAKEVTAIPYTDAGVNTTLATIEKGEPGPLRPELRPDLPLGYRGHRLVQVRRPDDHHRVGERPAGEPRGQQHRPRHCRLHRVLAQRALRAGLQRGRHERRDPPCLPGRRRDHLLHPGRGRGVGQERRLRLHAH